MITQREFDKVAKVAKDALRLASKHDPNLLRRVEVLERQIVRLGAPQYRLARKGKL